MQNRIAINRRFTRSFGIDPVTVKHNALPPTRRECARKERSALEMRFL